MQDLTLAPYDPRSVSRSLLFFSRSIGQISNPLFPICPNQTEDENYKEEKP